MSTAAEVIGWIVIGSSSVVGTVVIVHKMFDWLITSYLRHTDMFVDAMKYALAQRHKRQYEKAIGRKPK